jgi:sporulation protein YlmC with PRC-barrel domain
LPVVDTHVARQAGVVSDVFIDVMAGRVVLLNVQHADGWVVQRVPAEFVYRLGPHTVLVSDTLAVDANPPSADRQWFHTQALFGLEVLTEAGDRVGYIADVELDPQTLAVTAYVLKKSSGIWPGHGRVYPDEVVIASPEMMIVSESKKS